MQELVSNLADDIGIDPKNAEKAAGMILSLLQRNGEGTAVADLLEKLPGASELAANHIEPAPSGGGLMGMFGGLVGGSTGDAMATISALQADGLSTDQIKAFGSGLLSYARDMAGDDLVDQAISNIPGLDKYL